MKRTLMTVITLALMLAMSTAAIAANGVEEDFEDGVVDGGWHWSDADFIPTTGGNPDAYGQCPEIWVPTPTYFSGWDAPGWTGNYTSMGVTSFSIDVMTISSQNFYFDEYPLFLAIMNHMGTPNDIADDVFVYTSYDNLAPGAGTGWHSYQWDIPSDFVGGPGEMPAGWTGGNWADWNVLPDGMTWQDMMTNATRLEVRTLQFGYFANYNPYQMGADNVVLNYEMGPVSTEEMSFGSVKALYR
jgi:hypothetical protein